MLLAWIIVYACCYLLYQTHDFTLDLRVYQPYLHGINGAYIGQDHFFIFFTCFALPEHIAMKHPTKGERTQAVKRAMRRMDF